MKPSTLSSPLSLTNFEISEERGFLPAQDPMTEFPQSPDLESLGKQLPKLLAARQLRHRVKEFNLTIPVKDDQWDPQVYQCADRLLSFVAHAYIWENPNHPMHILPANLAVPWVQVSHKLGRPPVLSYASYALDNWDRLDNHQPIQLANIVLLQNFLGGLDEEWFVLVHVEIEAKAGPALVGILRAQEAARDDDAREVRDQLWIVASAQEAMCNTLDRMPERCDPYIYYNRVRPFIHGWKDNPAIPHGLIYEGVEEFKGYPQYFRGETGAQSSIIPAFDAALGVTHAADPLTHYLLEMRQYMPPSHRRFIEVLEHQYDEEGRPLLAGYVRDRKQSHSELWKAYRMCIQLLARFRAMHLEYAGSYIHHQSERGKSNPTAVGTGGTPFMTYLRKHLEETESLIES